MIRIKHVWCMIHNIELHVVCLYIYIFRRFQCHNADDKTDFSWHRSNWPEKWRWQNERPNPETLDQWTFDDSMVIWPGHSRNFCSSQVFPWMFEYQDIPRATTDIPRDSHFWSHAWAGSRVYNPCRGRIATFPRTAKIANLKQATNETWLKNQIPRIRQFSFGVAK